MTLFAIGIFIGTLLGTAVTQIYINIAEKNKKKRKIKMKERKIKMKELTNERLKLLDHDGYKVIFFKKYALVRKYSRFCWENPLKRFCPIYILVKRKDTD